MKQSYGWSPVVRADGHRRGHGAGLAFAGGPNAHRQAWPAHLATAGRSGMPNFGTNAVSIAIATGGGKAMPATGAPRLEESST